MRTLIDDAVIVTMDDKEPIVSRGYIDIEDTVIRTVGSSPMRPRDRAVYDRIVDGTGRMALPGLVNAHTHVGMMPFRNYASDLPLETWLFEKLFPMEDKLREEDIYWAARLGIAEMLRSGTTTFADMYMFSDVLGDAVAEAGIRADLARGLQCFDDEFDIDTDTRMQEARALYRQYHGAAEGRITVRFGPHAVYTCTPRYLQEVAAAASDLGTGIHMHLAETSKEHRDCVETYGKTPTQHLAELGVLDVPVMAAHGVHLSAEDRSLLQEHQVSVVHNPGSNLKLGSGVADVPALQRAGINVCLGTDSVSSNNNLDMIRELYLAAVLSKGAFEDSIGVKAHEALKMATLYGGRALGLDSIGALRAGMKADLILLDIDQPHYYPLHDPAAAVVYCGGGSDVHTVMVDGRILYEAGEFLTLDIEKAKAETRRISEDLFRR